MNVVRNGNIARIDSANSTAIRILGDPSEQNYNQVIVRKNVVAADPESSAATIDLFGVVFKNTTNAILENNILKDCDGAPIWYAWCTNFKSFNNQNADGTLARAYDLINSRYLMELQDFTEDALIGF